MQQGAKQVVEARRKQRGNAQAMSNLPTATSNTRMSLILLQISTIKRLGGGFNQQASGGGFIKNLGFTK